MNNLRKLFLMLFLVALSSYLPIDAFKLSEILDTAQPALLLRVSDCQITSKVLFDESPCSIFPSEPISSSNTSCDPVMAVLYPAPPRMPNAAALLLIFRQGSSQSRLEYSFVDIPLPGSGTTEMNKHEIRSGDFKLLSMSDASNSTESKLSAVLYDDVYGYLYVLLRENSSKTVCYVFTPKFGNKAILEEDFQYKFEVHHDFATASWSTNSYSQMFYYHARKDGELPIHLYAIPFPEILESLRGGAQGILVAKSSKAELMQVTGNLVYLSVSSEPGFSLFKSSVRERCTNFNGKLSQNTDFIFGLFGREYCKARYETNGDRMLCFEARHQIEAKPTIRMTWYFVVITLILIFAVIAAILCCIRCHILKKKSRKMEQEQHRILMRRSSESFDCTL